MAENALRRMFEIKSTFCYTRASVACHMMCVACNDEAVLVWATKCISDSLLKLDIAKRFRLFVLYNLIKKLLQGSTGQLSVTTGNLSCDSDMLCLFHSRSGHSDGKKEIRL